MSSEVVTPADIYWNAESTAKKGIAKVGKKVLNAGRMINGIFVPENWWHVLTMMMTTGLCVFTAFTVSTIVRGIYGDSWIGAVAIGAIFGVMTMMASAFSVRGQMPVFGLEGILIGLAPIKGKVKKGRSIRSGLHFLPALLMLITLLGAGYASAGISKAILGANYDNAAKVPNPAYNDGQVFFIEYFGTTIYYLFVHQMTLRGARFEYVAILTGFYWTAMQAIGYDISSASYNFVYWLTVNTVGFTSNFWVGWWIYLVAALASVATVIAFNWLLFFFHNSAMSRGKHYASA